jgi:hypothetical protein
MKGVQQLPAPFAGSNPLPDSVALDGSINFFALSGRITLHWVAELIAFTRAGQETQKSAVLATISATAGSTAFPYCLLSC